MVSEYGQLYTIEGVAAAVLMVLTTYLVLSTTTIYTPADTHVIDMQLEQLGSDVLAMMDTPDPGDTTSDLQKYLLSWDNSSFRDTFLQYVNYNAAGEDTERPIDFNAYITYRDSTDTIQRQVFNLSPIFKGTSLPIEVIASRPVTVTRWVYIEKDPPPEISTNLSDRRNANQTVLLEVILWRN